MSELSDQLLSVWRTSHGKTILVLEAVSDADLDLRSTARGAISVAGRFAAVHEARADHFERRAPALAEGLARFDAKDEPDRDVLAQALAESGRRFEDYIRYASAGVPGFKTFRAGLVQLVASFVAGEAHARGAVLQQLEQAGRPAGRALRDALGRWDRS
ncbi:MAG: hypothetical protein O3C51_17580 [Planctomycetota bacterium]|nr:hypothetical protein [Planctomycetota bacterium]